MTAFDELPDAIVRLDAERRIVEAARGRRPAAGRPPAEIGSDNYSPGRVRAPKRDGSPLLVDEWHSSSRLRSVAAIPEHEVTIAAADGDFSRARVTRPVRTQRRRRDHRCSVLYPPPAIRKANDEPTGSEVVSTVSHELRSPLTSVKG